MLYPTKTCRLLLLSTRQIHQPSTQVITLSILLPSSIHTLTLFTLHIIPAPLLCLYYYPLLYNLFFVYTTTLLPTQPLLCLYFYSQSTHPYFFYLLPSSLHTLTLSILLHSALQPLLCLYYYPPPHTPLLCIYYYPPIYTSLLCLYYYPPPYTPLLCLYYYPLSTHSYFVYTTTLPPTHP